ncbi:hypothetical protein VCSRO157_3492 [Vibrio cholerae]|nr:hypothetical protein VCSRO157_3492 [Vibrio cholerae]
MAGKTCYYWPTNLCRGYHSNILGSLRTRGSPAGHITLNFDSGLLRQLREYLKFSKSYVAQKLDIPVQCLNDIESGLQPIPQVLIEFYAQSLHVRTSYLSAILYSKESKASSRAINKVLNKYFGFIHKLKENEKK